MGSSDSYYMSQVNFPERVYTLQVPQLDNSEKGQVKIYWDGM